MKHHDQSTVRRSLALLHQMDSSFFPYVIAHGILQALVNFLPAIVLAQVVNKLIEQQNFRTIVIFAIIAVLGIWFVSMLQGLVEKAINVRSQNIAYSFETLVSRTNMSLEYAKLESEETKKMQR